MGGLDLVDQYFSSYQVASNNGQNIIENILPLFRQAIFNPFQFYQKRERGITFEV